MDPKFWSKSVVSWESLDGKFLRIPRFLAFLFPGNSLSGSLEKEPHELDLFSSPFEGEKEFFNVNIFDFFYFQYLIKLASHEIVRSKVQ